MVFDRQYSPFIFNYQGQRIVPAESVYTAFEAKQTINAAQVRYAQEKLSSVRRLRRTSLPIPTAGGTLPARQLQRIIGGLLTFESDWNPALGEPLTQSLQADNGNGRLDIGCVAGHGIFSCGTEGHYVFTEKGKPATAFLFELITRLQSIATVPMIDIGAYAQWLTK